MPSLMKPKLTFLFATFAVLFILNQTATAAPDGCSSADFRLARSLDATLTNGFPLASYAVADLDGDGKPDLAATDYFGNTVVVLLNDGTGRFVAPKKYAVGTRPSTVAAADFNGDGRFDLVVANSESSNVSVLFGSGGGLFTGATNFAAGSGPAAVGVGDLNGDGRADLAVGNAPGNGGGSVSVLLGNGSGSFSPALGSPFAIPGQAVSVALADFNSDAKRDLAVATSNGFFVLMGDGLGGFTAPSQVFAAGGRSVATSDLNGDGKPDLALGSIGLVVLLGDGAGGFSTPAVFRHESGASIDSVAVGDIDGDGKQDVAAAAGSPSGVTFFKGNGTGAFTPTRSYLPANDLTAIALGDFEGDGDLDIVAGESILLNGGSGSFEAARAAYGLVLTGPGFTSASPFELALGDFNADGRSDMAVLHRALIGPDQLAARVGILLRDVSGGFTLSSSIIFSPGSSLRSLVTADFNRDGRADVAIAGTISSPFSHVVSVSLSNGDGTFAAPINVSIGSQPFDIATGDFNNDGNSDLVAVTLNGGLPIVLLGNGSGSFNLVFGPNTGANFSRIAVADLNSDAKLDLIITDFTGRRVLTLSGDGAGSFGTLRAFDVPGAASAVAVGDFNLDGKRDLAVTSEAPIGSTSSDGNASILLGDGTGSFAAAVNYPVGEQPEHIVGSDFDGDGKPDLAVANGGSSSISVLSGDGSGIFRAAVSFKISGGPGTLVVDDFDSDGRADLATPLYRSRTVGLLLGKAATSEPCLFADDVTVTEGDAGTSTAEVTVRLSQASAQIAKVNYVLRGSSAIEGQDFVDVSGTLTFQPGETIKTVPVAIIGDTLDEDNESLTLNLSGALNARISDGVARITIADNDPPPTISINDVTVTEGDSSFNPALATFTVSLSAPSAKLVQVNFVTAGGTALAGEDFDTTQGTLSFAPGVTTQTITVGVRGDITLEPDETFFVNLSNPVNSSIADGQGQGTILNNDPVPAVSVFDVSAFEGAGVDTFATITIRLSNPSILAVSVDFATTDGTATAGSDYIASAGTVTFSPGETQKTLTVIIKDDSIDEVSETFSINLSNPTNATIADGQALCNIFDNDGPSVSINDVSVTEGQGGTTNATFTLTLSAPSVQDILVRVATTNGTATAQIDYQPISGRFVFIPVGSTSVTTNVIVIGDLAIEPDETFFINLSQPQNCTIADGQGVGTILNDDTTSVQFSTDAMTVNEADGIVQVTVLRVGQLSQPFTAIYSTFDGAASERSDYNAALGTLQFAPGEASKTITVFITDDALVENPESFFIGVSGPNGARTNPPSSLIITINSDDVGGSPNPVDTSAFFVRQHYRDFLNRDPDAAGLAFWINEIESCGTNAQCREVKRINVSAAFFLSIEFQETGYLVYRAYKAAFGDATSPNVPGTVPVIRLFEFLNDSRRVGQGVQVGIGNWQQQLEDNKNAYLLEFVQRGSFIASFPNAMSAEEFVAKLDQRAGGVLSVDEQAQLVSILGSTPADPIKRASVLRRVAEDSDLNQKEFNRAFVLMQFYGYLRRNPNDLPDANYSGWKFWLDKLDQFGGNFVQAEMVRAFLLSSEYKGRFGN